MEINSTKFKQIDSALDKAGDEGATNTGFADKAVKAVTRGLVGTARTAAMAYGTAMVAQETMKAGYDFVTGSAPNTYIGKAGKAVFGGFGEFLAIAATGYAAYTFGAVTARSGMNAYKAVVEVI
jgi:hypothetical protein